MRSIQLLALAAIGLLALACSGASDSHAGGGAGDALRVDLVVFGSDRDGSGGDAGGGAPAEADGGDGRTATGDADGGGAATTDGPRAGPDVPVAECGYGSVFGLVCDPVAQVFVGGAAVRVDAVDCNGDAVRRITIADEDGFFTLVGVPAGRQTVVVKKDAFEAELTALVVADALTDLTAAAREACDQTTGGNELCVKGQDEIAVETPLTAAQADIIWFIDTSGSMREETNWLQQNINGFAAYIGAQQIDYHVVLIADGYDLCVPEPLGGPGCTDGPRFRHVHEEVDSHDGLEQVVQTYPQYSDFLRAGATTNFVAVSDDNSDWSAAKFRNEASALSNPGFSDPFVFHSIVAMGPIPVIGCITGAFGGLVYLQLSGETGGATFPICETNWASMFGQVAETVVETVQSPCTYALPDPARAANADLMSLAFREGDRYAIIPKIGDADGCGEQGGWYIDAAAAPPALVLCPATCRTLAGGVLQLAYDCFD